MANVDVCNLTWDCVQEDKIVYERIKFPKTAKPLLTPPNRGPCSENTRERALEIMSSRSSRANTPIR